MKFVSDFNMRKKKKQVRRVALYLSSVELIVLTDFHI